MAEKTIGELVRQARRSRRWSQEHLGHLVEVDQTAISQIESGKIRPKYELTRLLAEALDGNPAHWVRTAGYIPLAEAPTGDVFDRAPLARLVSAVEALPGMADQLDQLDALSPGKQEEMIRRLARRFAFEISEELLAAESDKLAHSEK